MIKLFRERLEAVIKYGNLTKTDLSYLLGVQRTAMHQWFCGTAPYEGKELQITSRLEVIENFFPKGDLPVPIELNRPQHKEYVEHLHIKLKKKLKL